MLNQLEEILTREIRPYLSNHYGDIEVLFYDKEKLHIRLLGQCKNCPSARFTIENVIKTKIKEYIPELKEVILENSVNEQLYNFAKKLLRKNM